MKDKLLDRLKEQERYAKAISVYEIFKDYFGEDRVDLQGFDYDPSKGYILVWWPKVRITNEFGKYVNIKNLYARVDIYDNGSIFSTFKLNRSEYTKNHFISNYMHSHVSSIPKGNFEQFQSPCLGEGPIRDTTSSLVREYDEDLWRLYVVELDKYVATESIAGTPYNRLESIGAEKGIRASQLIVFTSKPFGRLDVIDFTTRNRMMVEFLQYFIPQNKLKFNYSKNSYSLGMSFVETVLTISNSFIEWYNNYSEKLGYFYNLDTLIRSTLLQRVEISGVIVIKPKDNQTSSENVDRYNGMHMCTFKGEDINIVITDTECEEERNMAIILDLDIISYIVYTILNVLNFKYGGERETDADSAKKVTKYL